MIIKSSACANPTCDPGSRHHFFPIYWKSGSDRIIIIHLPVVLLHRVVSCQRRNQAALTKPSLVAKPKRKTTKLPI